MISSKTVYKRARPALGTLVSITVETAASNANQAQNWMTLAYSEIERLENIFSFYRSGSELYRLNLFPKSQLFALSEELYELLHLSLEIWQLSDAAFDPFTNPVNVTDQVFAFSKQGDQNYITKLMDVAVDLGGIAKGYIVDQTVRFLLDFDEHLCGVINAGGDLRFFNGNPERSVHLRLGLGEEVKFKSLSTLQDAVASSTSQFNSPNSSTRYKAGTKYNSVTTLAKHCAVADGLNKVAFFADKVVTENMCRHFNSQILAFDQSGNLEQAFGLP